MWSINDLLLTLEGLQRSDAQPVFGLYTLFLVLQPGRMPIKHNAIHTSIRSRSGRKELE